MATLNFGIGRFGYFGNDEWQLGRVTNQRLMALHRRHLGAQMRAAGREVSLERPRFPQATSAALAARLLGRLTSPSAAVIRAEMKSRLHEALDCMNLLDRKVLTGPPGRTLSRRRRS